MIKSKIIYDSRIRTFDEWGFDINKLTNDYQEIITNFPNLLELTFLEEIQSHYFIILNNDPFKISSEIRNQVKTNLGLCIPIVLDVTLKSAKNCNFYRIDVSQKIDIYKKAILDTTRAWVLDRGLHAKGPKAIENLIEKLQTG